MVGAAGLHHRARWKCNKAHIDNDVEIWDSWDHYPTCAVIQEDEIATCFPARKRKKWTGRRPKNNEQKIAFQRDLMRNRGEKLDEKLVTIQKY